ncbi:hypothetical protein ACIRQF_36895 [Streptomyces sp. NPDC101191]|uniref:hypothetical protein n=1 Tax=Streptomyces sp. NPDC101191 TaxID=3366126 RepID=UPI00380152B6
MNVRYARKARRGAAAVALAAGLALVVTGCGSEEQPKREQPVASSAAPKASGQDGKASQSAEPTEVLGSLKGPQGLELTVTSVERDAGGFVTVSGQLKNTSDDAVAISSRLSGDETEIIQHSNSLGGATLVDSVGKKRYYVLRDTDGRPLTTTDLSSLAPGAKTNVFMQFPAPPSSTGEVSLQLPTFTPATIKLS